ncbi:hypothetical protein [Streptomyces atroolivaceus]|uniref:Uncharacterized protein n=1 Tax=Streptomyces atroolivaceus TaxID=66869 RepID=A0ABV9VEL8_STRAZ|nr:hypothetical protein [Streptomyces atroolivaceus]
MWAFIDALGLDSLLAGVNKLQRVCAPKLFWDVSEKLVAGAGVEGAPLGPASGGQVNSLFRKRVSSRRAG